MEVVKQGKIKFVPENWTKIYFQWLENIQDWCISRQLWWGHRIPAWYDEVGNIYVGENEHEIRQVNHLSRGHKINSRSRCFGYLVFFCFVAIYHFSWPNETSELKTFYPSAVLVTVLILFSFGLPEW